MKTATQNFVVSANGSVFGVYAGPDRNAALLAYVHDAGYTSVENAAAALEKSVEEFVDGTKVEPLAPLFARIEIVNAAVVIDENPHVAFDIAVDGNVVHSTLEWLDADRRGLVANDCHLDVSNDYLDAVEAALGDDGELYDQTSDDARSGVLGDIAHIVWEKLVAVVRELKKSAPEAA
ncbi:hypothetical protein BJF92_13650 [Rhizobium rhizosphaerae]|uniref:Uncharacterized protein n=1 Tax=Xaviernesmea rhizosphaerae TaxID=1672749 RepID=A0A1Q9AHW6_9HYPH|nr:hypothetical protein [Xaviernesmea rhizosphaerae]OLP54849.1 hypothetical protein BJF92_13650 [Xaviernesmea rhizosphaerae]